MSKTASRPSSSVSRVHAQAMMNEMVDADAPPPPPQPRSTTNTNTNSNNTGVDVAPDYKSMYHDLLSENKRLAEDRDRRTEMFLRRDPNSLEERVRSAMNEDDDRNGGKMGNIRTMHTNILGTIGQIQHKTTKILQEQERDLIRAFRARLSDLSDQLQSERSKNESGSIEWVQRCRKLTEELEWLRDLTDKLTAENKNVLKENRRFKRQMKTQEEDREFLIKQLVSVKKENARLRYTIESINANNNNNNGNSGGDVNVDIDPLSGPHASLTASVNASLGLSTHSSSRPRLRPVSSTGFSRPSTSASNYSAVSSALDMSRPQSAITRPVTSMSTVSDVGRSSSTSKLLANTRGLSTSSSTPNTSIPQMHPQVDPLSSSKECRYQSVISKLERQLSTCQKNYSKMRTQYTNLVSDRNELQEFLKKCIDDVRADIAQRAANKAAERERERVAAGSRARSAGGLRSSSSLRSKSSNVVPMPSIDPRSIPLSSFTAIDRINVMEWLLSQDTVIYMLYDKMFPRAQNQTSTKMNHPQQQNTGANNNSNTTNNNVDNDDTNGSESRPMSRMNMNNNNNNNISHSSGAMEFAELQLDRQKANMNDVHAFIENHLEDDDSDRTSDEEEDDGGGDGDDHDHDEDDDDIDHQLDPSRQRSRKSFSDLNHLQDDDEAKYNDSNEQT